MLGLPDQATIITIKDEMYRKEFSGWHYKDLDFLLIDLTNMIKAKTIGSSIMYFLMLFLAMLAIFRYTDTFHFSGAAKKWVQ